MSKGPFKLRSGNTTPFKQMGNSPVEHETFDEKGNWVGAGPAPESLYAKMSDAEKEAYMKSKEELPEEEFTDAMGYVAAQREYGASQEVSDVTPTSIKEGEEDVVAKEEIVKEKVTPEIGHTVVSRTGRSPGSGYEKIKGTNQWEYTGYGVS